MALTADGHTTCMYCGGSVCGGEPQVEHVGCCIGADNDEWERVTVEYARASLLAELRAKVEGLVFPDYSGRTDTSHPLVWPADARAMMLSLLDREMGSR